MGFGRLLNCSHMITWSRGEQPLVVCWGCNGLAQFAQIEFGRGAPQKVACAGTMSPREPLH
eukprot:9537158-Alexandrium_andersonii.AAC.1